MNHFDVWVRESMTCVQFSSRVTRLVFSTLVIPLLVFVARYYGDALPPAVEQFFSTKDILMLFLVWAVVMLYVFYHFRGGTALVAIVGSLCFAGIGAGLLSAAIGMELTAAGPWVMSIVGIITYMLALVVAEVTSFGLYHKPVRWFKA